jgi:hypothetical protein
VSVVVKTCTAQRRSHGPRVADQRAVGSASCAFEKSDQDSLASLRSERTSLFVSVVARRKGGPGARAALSHLLSEHHNYTPAGQDVTVDAAGHDFDRSIIWGENPNGAHSATIARKSIRKKPDRRSRVRSRQPSTGTSSAPNWSLAINKEVEASTLRPSSMPMGGKIIVLGGVEGAVLTVGLRFTLLVQ